MGEEASTAALTEPPERSESRENSLVDAMIWE